jgi:hypothetical protein
MHACTCQHMSVSACDSSAHEAHARTRHQPAPHRSPERRRNSSMSVDRGAEGHHGADMTSFVCPITREVMRDPVVTSDGQYRRSRIQTCPQQHQGSSMRAPIFSISDTIAQISLFRSCNISCNSVQTRLCGNRGKKELDFSCTHSWLVAPAHVERPSSPCPNEATFTPHVCMRTRSELIGVERSCEKL